MESELDRILYTAEQIRARVHALADEIAATYADEGAGLTLLPILAGSFIFTADLIRELPLKMKIALVQLSSYRGKATEAGRLETVFGLEGDLSGRHVLIVDDILDSGNTIRYVQNLVGQQGPASVRTAVLLRKPAKAPSDLHVDFVGFDVDNEFVVGYGLDYNDLYRNLPCIGVLKPECM